MSTSKNEGLHRLLRRQLRKEGLGPSLAPDAEQWASLLARISAYYVSMDEDRQRLTRALDTASSESEVRSLNVERGGELVEGLLKGLTESIQAFNAFFDAPEGDERSTLTIAERLRNELLSHLQSALSSSGSGVGSSASSGLRAGLVALDEKMGGLSANIVRMAEQVARKSWAEREIETASTAQKLLLPEQDEISRPFASLSALYQPASGCGGDWWNVHDLSDGRLLVIIGDVTGHGVAAAIITGAAKAACDLMLESMPDVFDHQILLSGMNTAIRNAGQQRFLMTCSLAIIDPHNMTIAVADAGHAPAILVRRRASEASSMALTAHGAPLGSTRAPSFRLSSFPLEPEDVICWYTDGLTEAENQQGQPFGEPRLRNLLEHSARWPASGIRDSVRHAVQRFSSGTEQVDDVTLVVARLAGARREGSGAFG